MTTSSGPGTSTAHAVSPDSGEHWTAEGAWEVADGIHRIPLPLPMDGLRAVNVYVVVADDGLTLVDGGWAIPQARELLERCLKQVGAGFGDIRRFLVTHVHRDHYTLARVLGTELGVDVALGLGDRPALELMRDAASMTENPFAGALRTAGALDLAEQWNAPDDGDPEAGKLPDPAQWAFADTWLDGDQRIEVGPRTLDAVHTPGHTPGHYVYAERDAGLLFAGDHVLPTITPSIGFTMPTVDQPLGDFMASLTKVRSLPDLRVLPAHGPVAPSSHVRVDELLAHHETRLTDSLAALSAGPRTAHQVAGRLGWTRHEHAYDTLDVFSRGMAAMETKAHLELLVARGLATRSETSDGVVFAAV
ncbi:MBL fold metallo-hydrolase [Nocardioides marmotae]|uniref:MBL fold metallo-hydrolase n=1 Tax=Nocardioides marmotae TaxID=2663857 RepID=A0A6I3J8Q8_9ACTN|nr:MBL fold metallo-hydrolase [Nocardioides marmotae]MCR6029940.1 MBL fold metallo-hydrolase [Gordonia jinghuaiqii]MBC9732896.1 MBL fold metallo-hydrolase [Nocardioides marmotae]MTB84010.1 MBL fold metallo-hydrolase [Nocardioides marmotae]MTB93570.1 MBL fold metallo-hydrolase [Nocardioides marmotae]QKD99939.1 MBL fold metallo-hydrolase [Nocardioides marmotae]